MERNLLEQDAELCIITKLNCAQCHILIWNLSVLNGNVGRITHNTVTADDLTNELDMEDLTLGEDAAVEPEADIAVEPETDATVGQEANATVGLETEATIGLETDASVAQETMSGSQAETVEHLPENLNERATQDGIQRIMRSG